ncbi:hypothetical protein BHYA_0021g00650 [Botrytis hyacinthi]|uniref:Uncharacterized protein n=1 Tax=Botrytis hyacinthi TaxID=278943 RepID=A0A4Z1H8E8_9HELO|nr:hypothetical protein BHYA_0021g00650 [Botrytis hyacinthi]
MSSRYLLDVHIIVGNSGLLEVLFEQFKISYYPLTSSGENQPRMSSELISRSYAMYLQPIHYEVITP